MKIQFLRLLILMLPLSVYAEITFSQLAQISAAPVVLEGRFTQEKYLSALDASLVSKGVFNYQRGKLIRWEILEPIQNQLIMTPTSITSRQGDRELLKLEPGSNPMAAIWGKVFFSLLTAEWSNLSGYFNLTGHIDGRYWDAVLIPQDQTIKHVFNRIELKGGPLLDEIILHENSGDQTTIRLDNLRE